MKNRKRIELSYDTIIRENISTDFKKGHLRHKIIPEIKQLLEKRPITSDDIVRIYTKNGHKISSAKAANRTLIRHLRGTYPFLNIIRFYLSQDGRNHPICYFALKEKLSPDVVKFLLHSDVKTKIKVQKR